MFARTQKSLSERESTGVHSRAQAAGRNVGKFILIFLNAQKDTAVSFGDSHINLQAVIKESNSMLEAGILCRPLHDM